MKAFSRREAVFALLASCGVCLSGCVGAGQMGETRRPSFSSDASRGSSNGSDETDLSLVWDALLLRSDAGVSDGQKPLSQMALGLYDMASNVVLWRNDVLVGAGPSLLKLDAASGEVLRRFDLADIDSEYVGGDVMGLTVADTANDCGMAYLATSGGFIVALGLDSGVRRWMTHVCPTRLTGWLAQNEDSSYEDLPAAWSCTVPAVYGGAAVVGFSSYQLENASTLACVDADTGVLRWTRQLEGRLDAAGGLGYPVAVDAGVLLPMPDGGGLALLSWQTGETLDLLETDSEIYMGLTMSDSGVLPCFFQSRLGVLYRADVEDGALVATSVQDACTEQTKRIPSGARPLVADGLVIVNGATQNEDAPRFDAGYDPSRGELVIFDAETLELVERRDASEIESTPVRMGDDMFYLGRDGVYRSLLLEGVPSTPELVFDGEGRDRDVWDQQLLAADNMLFFIGGPYGERRLYAFEAK